MTKKEFAELEAKVKELERQKAEIEDKLSEAQSQFYAAQREFNRAQKLTPAMVVVLKAMNAGAKLIQKEYPDSGQFTQDSEGRTYITSSVFYGLKQREMIEKGQREGVLLCGYRLTEHGRKTAEAIG